ncbi:MAG: hypothetical protein ACRCUQ_04240 [Alphaproteobacteria bacterium]
MAEEQKILDDFGKIFMKKVRDASIELVELIMIGQMGSKENKELCRQFQSLSPEAQEVVKNFLIPTVDKTIHYFLWMIEQHEEFDLVYRGENKEKLVSLRDISEMLCAEPTGEDGWIERFSKYPPSVS